MTTNRPLISATRNEGSFSLQVSQGSLPTDWYGHVFINSPAGNVNSNGLPYPPTSPDQGSPIMNGDGYVYRFDLTASTVNATTALMKPPCYYADVATKIGNTNGFSPLEEFRNMGISRISVNLGARNELNTAISPVKFKGDKNTRMLACYDVGKPWEIDMETLGMITAIGANNEYAFATPDYLFPFPVIQTTAHPSFDPFTQELFISNFTKNFDTMTESLNLVKIVAALEGIEKFILSILHRLMPHAPQDAIMKEIQKLIQEFGGKPEKEFLDWLHRNYAINSGIRSVPPVPGSSDSMENNVFLMRWTGKQAPMDKWRLVDSVTGNPIQIVQCMHQTTITEDYIILADATYKFAFDLLFNGPFESNELNNWLRMLLTMPQLPYLTVYLVKRSDLKAGVETVPCTKISENIPLEAVHFTADYKNPNDEITLHLAHNSAACLAEWVRKYDVLASPPNAPVDPQVIGLISAGCMDIGRIGKVVIDGIDGNLKSQQYLEQSGNLKDIPNIGAHTWGVGLFTYRDAITAESTPDVIRHNYWSSYGLDPRLLTKFIYDLYTLYPNQIYTPTQMQQITTEGIPFVLSRQNVATMELEDFYQFEKGVYLKSVQFVPRISGSPKVTDDIQKDGYIFTTELVNYPNSGGDNYQCEIWIFKAWDLSSGPCCKLVSPELNYAFTLHSVWTSDAVSQNKITYYIDPKADYDPLIAKLEPSIRRPIIQDLFNKYIYPNFKSPQ